MRRTTDLLEQPNHHSDLNIEKIVERTAEFPVTIIERGDGITRAITHGKTMKKVVKKGRGYWEALGPGLTTGAADDDPSGIATYSQTGAQYGFQLLWLAPFSFVLMGFVQEMCARIGMVTGRGLASTIRRHFSRRVLYICTILLLLANTFNIGADLGAMAAAVKLIFPHWNYILLIIGFALLSLTMQIMLPYQKYARILKYFALTLLAYFVSAVLAHLDWGNVVHGLVLPSITFNKDQIILICAIFGTTISPYLFFWQTSQEVEQEIEAGKTSIAARAQLTTKAEVHNMRVDVWSGMFLSNLTMFFIIATCGGVLYAHGITNITTASEAAQALRPFAGNTAYLLFAIGIVGVGLLGIPVLAGSSSYAFAESLHLRGGLSKKMKQARAFYGILIFSVVIGVVLGLSGLDPIKALIYSAVANGVAAPLILWCIVAISSNKKTMGQWVNSPLVTAVGWVTVGVMAISGIAAIYALFL